MTRTPQDILGLPPNPSRSDVERAYLTLAKQYHPDRNPGDQEAPARMEAINAAYAALVGRAPAVDEEEQRAISVLAQSTDSVIQEILQRDGTPACVALADLIRHKLQMELELLQVQEKGIQEGIRKIESVRGRFTGRAAPLMEDVVEGAILGNARGQHAQTLTGIRALERALKLFQDCAYKHEQPKTLLVANGPLANYLAGR